jgi:hypothetical protein
MFECNPCLNVDDYFFLIISYLIVLGPTHGICECGVCRCLKGFTGENCGCSTNSNGCISSDGVSILWTKGSKQNSQNQLKVTCAWGMHECESLESKYTLYHPSVMISAWEQISSRGDIWTRAEKGYDMKNDMLWYAISLSQKIIYR